jgi:hypothetical protein
MRGHEYFPGSAMSSLRASRWWIRASSYGDGERDDPVARVTRDAEGAAPPRRVASGGDHCGAEFDERGLS